MIGGVLLEVDGRQRRVDGIPALNDGRGRGIGACELSRTNHWDGEERELHSVTTHTSGMREALKHIAQSFAIYYETSPDVVYLAVSLRILRVLCLFLSLWFGSGVHYIGCDPVRDKVHKLSS